MAVMEMAANIRVGKEAITRAVDKEATQDAAAVAVMA